MNRAIPTYLINKAGFKISQVHTGAVTLIKRFGSALNLKLQYIAVTVFKLGQLSRIFHSCGNRALIELQYLRIG